MFLLLGLRDFLKYAIVYIIVSDESVNASPMHGVSDDVGKCIGDDVGNGISDDVGDDVGDGVGDGIGLWRIAPLGFRSIQYKG